MLLTVITLFSVGHLKAENADCSVAKKKLNDLRKNKPKKFETEADGNVYIEELRLLTNAAEKACEPDEKDAETCKETKEEYNNLYNACHYIAKAGDESTETHKDVFEACEKQFNTCSEYASNPKENESDAEGCQWFGRQNVSQELIVKQKESIEKKEQELIEKLSESQVSQQEQLEKKQEIRKSIEQKISKNMADMQQTLIDAQTSEADFSAQEKQAMDEYRTQMNALKASLRLLKSTNVMAIDSKYDSALKAAINECKVKAKAQYLSEKGRMQAKFDKGQGVSMSAFYKWSKTKKADKINFYMNTCIEDDSDYSQKVIQAQKDRNIELSKVSNDIQKVTDDILNLQQSFSDQMNTILKTKTSHANALKQKHAQLQQNIQVLQQQLQEMSRPKQSEMVAMLQQQKNSIREHNALQGMKEKVAILDKVPLEKDDFKLLNQISGVDEGTPDFKDAYESCLPDKKSKTNFQKKWKAQ